MNHIFYGCPLVVTIIRDTVALKQMSCLEIIIFCSETRFYKKFIVYSLNFDIVETY